MAATAACYAICGTAAAACFTSAGFVFGTVPGAQIAAVPALVTCNAEFATCEAACMAAAGIEAATTVGAVGLAGAALSVLPAAAVGLAIVGAVRYFWK